jgi:hypothetical protein
MSAFIKLNKQDAFITPYTAHKSYSYTTNQERIIAGIRFRLGSALSSSYERDYFPTGANKFHSSINQLYYSNYSASFESGSFENYNQSTLYFTKSLQDNVAIISIPQFLFGENIKPGTFEFNSASLFHITDDGEGNLFTSGAVSYSQVISSSVSSSTLYFQATASSAYDNIPDLETINFSVAIEPNSPNEITLDSAYLKKVEWTGSPVESPFYLQNGGTQVSIISESVDLAYLEFPNSSRLTSGDRQKVQFQDNLAADNINFYFESSSIKTETTNFTIYESASIADGEYLGNIFYSHGMLTLTRSDIAQRLQEQVLRSGSLSWKGSHTVYEHTYNCRSNQSQLNYSLNPSTFNSTLESGSINDNVTGSYFQPYVTTVGLYNDANELIAIGKLGQPIPKSQHVDMTFAVKFDS